MERDERCVGVTKSGIRCKRRRQPNNVLCHMHTEQIPDTDPDKICPICLCDDGELTRLSCSHELHMECASHMTKAECPVCRADASGSVPDEILQKIDENYSEHMRSRGEQEFEEFVASQEIPPDVIAAFESIYQGSLRAHAAIESAGHSLPVGSVFSFESSDRFPTAEEVFAIILLNSIQREFGSRASI